ncbi:hypothetical protein GGADHKLB_00605 [[Clostridium] scindens]|uniref:hypothetical protein n=1 Tax=Clostridium scindens (strain JCM 10418 / VPI 12708) TaxID=29347 RepID=UPI0022F3F0FB|nr:hypothetical protein [[Clostridium] scindens]WBX64598.1 hypothetical protein GGADHKLB_00605 [[Clostridium] scindens]
MRSKRKISIDAILLIILVLSVFEVVFFIILKAGVFQRSTPALQRISYVLVNRYSYILDMLNDISLAYIMSYIFYVVVLIPENRKQQSINKYVSIYLSNMSQSLDDIIQISNEFTNTGGKNLTDSPNVVSVLRRDTGRYEFLSYREHFIKFYLHFNEEYQHMSHYIAFIDNDLRDCLYEIVTCDFLNKINDLLINANDNEFDNVFEDNFNITAIAELTVRLKQLF